MKTSIGAKTIVYPTPVFIVGTYDNEGVPNAMTVAWGGVCCSQPPCVAISVRKATHTYSNLLQQMAFTVSIPSEDHVAEADFFGLVSGRDVNKFGAAGLTPIRSELVNAPYVGEFPLALECSVLQVSDLGLHTHFVGEILDVKVEEQCLGPSGEPSAELIRPFMWAPGENRYYAMGEFLARAFSVGRAVGGKG